jgi:hypothetical protein
MIHFAVALGAAYRRLFGDLWVDGFGHIRKS